MATATNGTINGKPSSAECSLNKWVFSGYFANETDDTIDKINFGTKVRFYIDSHCKYNANIKFHIKSKSVNPPLVQPSVDILVKEATVKELNPSAIVDDKRYVEIQLKKRNEYKSLSADSDYELCCSVTDGLICFIAQDDVAKISLEELKWHDPIKNPQINKYSFNGHTKPWNAVFGDVRKGNNSIYHSGIDLFALPGTSVYACLDGIVKEIKQSVTAGLTVRIKINSSRKYIDRINVINYKLQFEQQGEELGVALNESDDIYLIYMHLSECNVAIDTNVNIGQIIGTNGVTGNSNETRGPHLHFEVANILDAYGTGKKHRTNPARVVALNAYDNLDQDESVKYRYYKNNTKIKA